MILFASDSTVKTGRKSNIVPVSTTLHHLPPALHNLSPTQIPAFSARLPGVTLPSRSILEAIGDWEIGRLEVWASDLHHIDVPVAFDHIEINTERLRLHGESHLETKAQTCKELFGLFQCPCPGVFFLLQNLQNSWINCCKQAATLVFLRCISVKA